MVGHLPLAVPTWGPEEFTAMTEVMQSGQFTMGPRVRRFQRELASYHHVDASVMVNSGSSANLLMMAACRYGEAAFLRPGDEVIVPAVSWGTTYYPINQVGARIRLVDVDPHTLNLTAEGVAEKIGPRTKAVLAVNLLGNPAPLDQLSELCAAHNLVLLEDNCESLGAELHGRLTGTFGAMGSLSFFFSHHISTMEGGAVLVRDPGFLDSLLMLRAHGWTRDLDLPEGKAAGATDRWGSSFNFVLPGYNVRPIEIEAAVGSVQLSKLEMFLEARRSNAATWQALMSGVDGVRIQREMGQSSWFGFSMVLTGRLRGKRPQLVQSLNDLGIESRPIVAGNIMRHPVSDELDIVGTPDLPIADEIHDQGLFVGNHHYDIAESVQIIHELVRDL